MASNPRSMSGAARRFARMPRAERRLVWPALWRLLVVRACLALLGFRRSMRLLGRCTSPPVTNPDWLPALRALVRAGSRLPGTRCLARAMALRWWMRRAGLPAELVIGVRAGGDNSPDVHAWVNFDGRDWDWPLDRPGQYRPISRELSADAGMPVVPPR